MTEPMTLEQARDWLRENPPQYESSDPGVMAVIAALDAHLAAMGEPVAWLRNDAAVARPDLHVITTAIRDIWTKVNAQHVERYTIPLFRAQPASGDWDKVRDVIDELRIYDIPATRTVIKKLTAALPESQP